MKNKSTGEVYVKRVNCKQRGFSQLNICRQMLLITLSVCLYIGVEPVCLPYKMLHSSSNERYLFLALESMAVWSCFLYALKTAICRG